jgi:hypothetical protein
VIAVRDEPVAERLDAIFLETGRRRRFVLEWWVEYASQTISFTPEDAVRQPGWRPLTMELPKDWQEGYLRAIGGNVEFVYGNPPPPASRKRGKN